MDFVVKNDFFSFNEVEFNSTVNVIFGKNGAGKTLFLKTLFNNEENFEMLRNNKYSYVYLPILRTGYENDLTHVKNELIFKSIVSNHVNLSYVPNNNFEFETYNKEFFKARQFVLNILNKKSYLNDEIAYLFKHNANLDNFTVNSDGYKSVINIICYIIYKSVQPQGILNSSLRNITSSLKSVVLIDEIDAYIHQEIQFKIIKFLKTIFPNCKFIITTHSPMIIKTIEKSDQIYELTEGFIIKKTNRYFEEMDLIIQENFDINYQSGVSSEILEKISELAIKPQLIDQMDDRVKKQLSIDFESIIENNSHQFSEDQLNWINYFIKLLNK